MNDDSHDDSQGLETKAGLTIDQTNQRNEASVASLSEENSNPDRAPLPRTKRFGFSLRSLFQIRLSLLLLLFVPVALYFKGYANRPEVTYIEDQDLFWEDGFTEIDFSKKTDGTPLARQQNVNSAFKDLGITFAKGLPFRKPETETAPGMIQAIYLKSEKEQDPKNLRGTKNAKGLGGPKGSPSSKSADPSKTGGTKRKTNIKPKPTGPGYIGISGYPFKFPNCQSAHSICVFDTIGSYTKRFKGSMTIRFHEPGKPKQAAGVHAIGFYAARLNHPEAIEIRAYNFDGALLCRQKNIADRPCAFMSLKSKTLISRIEIETIGADEDYAVAKVMFDKVQTPGILNQR